MPTTKHPDRLAELFAPGSVAQAAQDIASGRSNCVQMVERCASRADISEPSISAFIAWHGSDALTQARLLDHELAAGRPRGPLHGIPFAVKDIIDVAGIHTTAASNVTDRVPASTDATIVSALRLAGAIFIGKVNTHEFAYGATTPPTRNPSDRTRIAGGSSGGSAAAVAAGSALLAIGSDTGGSIRLPAALCGVAAWRPLGTGEIGIDGILPLATEFDQWGLIAPNAEDLELAWFALRGPAARSSSPAPIFVVPSDLVAALPDVSNEVAEVFDREIDILAVRGVHIVRAEFPDFSDWRKPRMAVQMRAVLGEHRSRGWWPERRALYGEETRQNLEAAEARQDEPLDEAFARIAVLDAQLDALLGPSRVLVFPTTPVTAPRAADLEAMRRVPSERHPIVGLLSQATLPVSRNTLTSLTLPARRTSGLPVGIQLVAQQEDLLFAAARLYGAREP